MGQRPCLLARGSVVLSAHGHGQRMPWAGLPMAIHSFAAITKTNASGYHLLVFFVSILGISMGIRVVYMNTLHCTYIQTCISVIRYGFPYQNHPVEFNVSLL